MVKRERHCDTTARTGFLGKPNVSRSLAYLPASKSRNRIRDLTTETGAPVRWPTASASAARTLPTSHAASREYATRPRPLAAARARSRAQAWIYTGFVVTASKRATMPASSTSTTITATAPRGSVTS